MSLAAESSLKHVLESSDSDFDAGPSSSVPKKAKVAASSALSVPTILSLSSSALSSSKKADLVEIIETLRNHITGKSDGAGGGSGVGGSAVPDLGPQIEIRKKLLAKSIKAALVWKPSCKTGTAKFSCELHLPSPIFDAMFDTKRKLFKLSTDAFEEILGTLPYGTVRYATLEIKGDLSIRYKVDEETLTVSGHYGK